MHKCAKCGADIQSDAQTCSGCGLAFVRPLVPVDSPVVSANSSALAKSAARSVPMAAGFAARITRLYGLRVAQVFVILSPLIVFGHDLDKWPGRFVNYLHRQVIIVADHQWMINLLNLIIFVLQVAGFVGLIICLMNRRALSAAISSAFERPAIPGDRIIYAGHIALLVLLWAYFGSSEELYDVLSAPSRIATAALYSVGLARLSKAFPGCGFVIEPAVVASDQSHPESAARSVPMDAGLAARMARLYGLRVAQVFVVLSPFLIFGPDLDKWPGRIVNYLHRQGIIVADHQWAATFWWDLIVIGLRVAVLVSLVIWLMNSRALSAAIRSALQRPAIPGDRIIYAGHVALLVLLWAYFGSSEELYDVLYAPSLIATAVLYSIGLARLSKAFPGCGFVLEPAVVASDQSHPKSVRARIMTTTNINKLILFLVLGPVLLWAMVSCHEQYHVFVVRQHMSLPLGEASAERSEIADFYKKHKRLPRDAAEAGVDPTAQRSYAERVHYEAGRGEIHIVVRRIAPELNGRSIVLRAIPGPAELYWSCGTYDIPLKYLPNSCRESFKP